MNNLKQPIEIEEELGVALANKWKRIIAFLLDLILIGAFILMFITNFVIPVKYGGTVEELNKVSQEYMNTSKMTQKELFTKMSPELKEMIQVSQGYTVFMLWMYFAFSEILMSGGSLGKKVFSLRVVNSRTLEPPRLFDSILRSGLKTLALITWIPIFIVNFFLIFITKRNQAGHDLLTRTIVIEGTLVKETEKEEVIEEEF